MSLPAKNSQRRNSPRWRPRVVKMFGGPPVPAPRPIARRITAVTGPRSRRAPGAMRGDGARRGSVGNGLTAETYGGVQHHRRSAAIALQFGAQGNREEQGES